jgi:D-alanyl-D-alanine carboxypeptidase/D-alanyl-D-alanine-endopeptidase (penicillin-binding protein 4)
LKVKSLRYITTLFVATSFIGLQAQTEQMVADTATTDTAVVVLPWPQNVQARLDSLMLDPLLESTQLGLMVYDLTADSLLYSHGAKQTLRPASTMKLLTAVTAIDLLGGDFKLNTSLRYMGTVKDSVLTGDLICVGGLDPMFDANDMRAFVESVKGLGVDTIRGRLVAAPSFKESELFGEGWCWDDDNPQLSPLLVERKDEFMSVFANRLREAGIVVEASITTAPYSKDALMLCLRSHTLKDVLMPMLKESDNLYAESLFFQIAASQTARPAKAAHARQIIKRELSKAGVTGVPYRIADGSGLSLYNYVTPELMVKLLCYAYKNTKIFMQLYPALPIAGQDGTLKKRMTGPYTNGKVKAKTGTLTGISSLAGYLTTANGHVLAFSIINQGVLKNADGRGFQDKVCTALCEP